MNEINTNLSDCSMLLSKKNDKDYSGYDFIGCHLTNKNTKDFNNSFFKGCVFDNIKIYEAELKHVEFDESVINNNSYFNNCEFDSSDFIYNTIENTTFENCTFLNGEWRESSFENVNFINCDFTNATINLCTFINCHFDNFSSERFHGKGKNYNVFYKTIFPYCNINFLEHNFGLTGHQKLIEKTININSIYFEISYLYFVNQLLQKQFIENILTIIREFDNSTVLNYQAKLKYCINIINMMSKYHLSVFSSEYLYDKIYQQIKFSQNQIVVLELMRLFTSLKENIQYKELEIKNKFNKYSDYKKDIYIIEFIFINSYSKEQMENFIKALCIKLEIQEYKILKYSIGSTILETALTYINDVKSILETINYFIPQINEVVNNVKTFKQSIFNNEIRTTANSEVLISHPLQIRDTTINNKIIIETEKVILEIEGDVKRVKIS